MQVKGQKAAGHECPACRGLAVNVVDSRPTKAENQQLIRRRKACRDCGYRWTTVEVSAAAWGSMCDILTSMRKSGFAVPNFGLSVRNEDSRN